MRLALLPVTRRAILRVIAIAMVFNLLTLVARADEDDHHRSTSTPIKHVVVIFRENVSFDHYFATYPEAANLPGEPAFTPKRHPPVVNTLASAGLNVGDLLNAQSVTWGWFEGGFQPSRPATFDAAGRLLAKAQCATSHLGSNGKPKGDYIPDTSPSSTTHRRRTPTICRRLRWRRSDTRIKRTTRTT